MNCHSVQVHMNLRKKLALQKRVLGNTLSQMISIIERGHILIISMD